MDTVTENRRRIDRLIFVYAADSGRLSALVDSAKKLLQIKGCSLCAITHGLAGERSEWRECREEIGVPVDIFHRDDMPPQVAAAAGDRLPCVLAEVGGELVPLLQPEVIDRMRGNVADFRGRIMTHAAMRKLELPVTPLQPSERVSLA
jgi:hypothetical protein